MLNLLYYREISDVMRTSPSTVVTLNVEPSVEPLIDDPVHITITGLDQRGQKVTVFAVVVEEGNKFVSCGHYECDHEGVVDLEKMESTGGTYTGVEPMGLFWSLQPAPGQKRGLRLMKRDARQPLVVQLTVVSGHWTTEVDLADHPSSTLATKTIYRRYMAQGVTAFDIRAGKLRGRLFLPPGDGPFPGVIDMFGTAGGLYDIRAALLASRGFAGFSLAFFGYEDLPENMALNIEYFVEAVEWLSRHPRVMKSGIGVIGTSKGASLAMQMAIESEKVKAVVAINTYCFHSAGILYRAGKEQDIVNIDMNNFTETAEGFAFGPAFTFKEQHRPAIVQIEESRCADFLFIVSEDDTSCDQNHVKILVDRMKEHHPVAANSRCTVLTYPGAGHLIEPPYSPLFRAVYAKIIGTIAVFGGETKSHAVAQRDSWTRILQFLRQRLTMDHTQNSFTAAGPLATITSKL